MPLENFFTEAVCLDLSHKPLKSDISIEDLQKAEQGGGRHHQAEGHRAAAHGFLPPHPRHAGLHHRLSRPDQGVGDLARQEGHRHVRRRGGEPRPAGPQQFRGASRLPRPRLHAHGGAGQSRQAGRQGPLPVHRLPDQDQGRHRRADPRGGVAGWRERRDAAQASIAWPSPLLISSSSAVGAGRARQASSMPRASCRSSWSTCATLGAHNFVGAPIDGYEQAGLLSDARGRGGAGRRWRAISSRAGWRIKAFDCYRPERAVRAFRALGAQPRRHRAQGRVLSRRRQAQPVPRRLYRGALRPFARLDHRPDAGAARRRRPGARHGHAVRLLQPARPRRPTGA